MNTAEWVKTTSYLFVANAFVCVVQLVGEDLSVASEGFVPTQRDRGWCVRHCLQVGSRARHLDWWENWRRRTEIRKPSNWNISFSHLVPSPLLMHFVTSERQELSLAMSSERCQKHILGHFKATLPNVSKSSDHKTAQSLQLCGDQSVPSGLGCEPCWFSCYSHDKQSEGALQ